MRTPFGQTVRNWAGVFAICESFEEAERLRRKLEVVYKDYNVYVVNLKEGVRLRVIDLDPDLADLSEGYAVVVEASGV
ncbi:MAG: hypothetical protein NO126_02685 [Sulfolobales archaeon]|nr:hypothetical protein [Sulfolobales archaeon]